MTGRAGIIACFTGFSVDIPHAYHSRCTRCSCEHLVRLHRTRRNIRARRRPSCTCSIRQKYAYGCNHRSDGSLRVVAPTPPLRQSVFRDVLPLPKDLLDLFRFCSDYYHHPLGEVVLNGLPTKLRSNKPFVKKIDADFRYRLTPTGGWTDLSHLPARNIVKRRLLARLQGQGEMSMSEAREISSRAVKAINDFIAAGWVEKIPVSCSGRIFDEPKKLPELTSAQKIAVDSITAKANEFHVWLLHGITGSGKTQVYLRLILLLLRQARQTLVLAPEINLTPQLEASFRSRFPAVRLVKTSTAVSTPLSVRRAAASATGRSSAHTWNASRSFYPIAKAGIDYSG